MSVPKFTMYCLPFISTLSAFLALFALILPTKGLKTQALVIIHSHSRDNGSDGPTLWLGLFRVCWRDDKTLAPECTKSGLLPNIANTSKLFNQRVTKDLVSPPKFLWVFSIFSCISIGIMFIHAILSLMLLLTKWREWWKFMEKRIVKLCIALTAVATLFTGQAFLMAYMWFSKTSRDFNKFIVRNSGASDFEIRVATGGSFVLAAVAYSFITLSFVATAVDYVNTPKSAPGDGKSG